MKPDIAPGLVFSGQARGIIPWTLVGFILLSAVVHAFGFYLFQTVYPPAGHIAPPPVQVSLLMPGTPEADALLRWVEAEDPALAAQPRKAPVPGLMSLPYVPSFTAVHARPSIVQPPPEPLPFPAGASGVDLVKMATPRSVAAAPPQAAAAPTTLTFSDGLQPLDANPDLAGLRQTETGELQAARFLLAISDKGETRYVFLQDSSGDKSLDAQATELLAHLVFHPQPAPLAWGFATFAWGSAVYAHAPLPSAAPAKP